jgi:uncharacterized protein YndB with AHSA1/START domain
MAEILFDFPIIGPPAAVFAAVATPDGLEKWWTRGGTGEGAVGAVWAFDFGPSYQWKGVVRAFEAERLIEWELTVADPDWTGTRVRIALDDPPGGLTWVRFAHTGWREPNEHHRITAFCWAMYLRHMKHWVQDGRTVPYDRRLEV